MDHVSHSEFGDILRYVDLRSGNSSVRWSVSETTGDLWLNNDYEREQHWVALASAAALAPPATSI